ncbi:MAG: 2-hydroxyacyl-CoA dehydratase family protein [Defluviitaleaceae bacterium]|nr:2-hydroxyacyl-CoA dehydratase family protein [Defluviitaleaceae bacterium]
MLTQLELASRYLQTLGKKYMASYIHAQMNTLANIDAGKDYVLCTYYIPSELVNLFDIEYVYIERIVGLAAGLGLLKDVGKSLLPDGTCSYQKAFVYLIEIGLLAKPRAILALDYPCNDSMELCRFIHKKYGIPIYDVSLENLENDLENVEEALASFAKMGRGKREVVELSNYAGEIKKKIDDTRIKYPGVISSDDCLKMFTIENCFGTKTAVDTLKEMLVYAEGRKAPVNAGDRLRIFWMGLIPLNNNSILSKAEKSCGCLFVFEEMWMFTPYFISPSDFYKDLAEKIRHSLFYDIKTRVRRITDICAKTKTGLVIEFLQSNCSFLPKASHSIQEHFSRGGIPYERMSCDVVSGAFQLQTLVDTIRAHLGDEK